MVDLVVSIITIVLIAASGVVAGAMYFMMFAFTDSCPPERCSIEGAVTALLAAFVVGLVVGVGGSIAAIVRLVRRKLAWPWAVGALVACGVIAMLGVAGYLAAVGG